MPNNKAVEENYSHGDLLKSIEVSITKLGKTVDNINIEDLAPVDEFHIGGRLATERFIETLNFTVDDHLLDVGCGLGGASRFVASKYQNKVSGIDLTQEYIDTGKILNTWIGLDKQVTLVHGSALSMPFDDKIFDGAFMMHVGMNIEDKAQLFTEVYRVLRPGSSFGVYDIMRIKHGELDYPVPWAKDKSTSYLATSDQYKENLNNAGFTISEENNRSDFAMEFFKNALANAKANGGPPPLGLHTLLKESTAIKMKHMINNVSAGYIAPVEIVALKH